MSALLPSRIRRLRGQSWSRSPGLWLGAAAMALLAYVPTLMSSPGRMSADTKLYLYLNPRRLVADSIWSFDGRQFGGWVPHQMIAYLWPSGPWYVVAESVGLPDWVAHRLWLGTIMFAAGTGVAWAAHRLGLSVTAAIAAGLIYQLSPYIVPYVSRTSSMLLPWAGLGWIIGLTIGAAVRTRWRDAALCALVIATVGGVNATALVMIAPGPVLWLVVAALERTISPRRAVFTALRIGALAVATSLWWIVMLLIQGVHGADLLAYSESLEDVSLTATSPEVWRSLGYWLMYIRDAYAATTTAGAEYMDADRALVLGFVLVVISLVGLAAARFRARRYAIVLTFTGLMLAVGVHRFSEPSPIAGWVVGDGQEGLALALRSSTRALPLMTIGLALGAGALIDVIGGTTVHRSVSTGRTPPARRIVLARRIAHVAAAVLVVLIAIGNNPVVAGHGFVDPALERDEQPPDAWIEAAATLDELPVGYRLLRIPGAEFGAFTWGYTVDPPLPALTDRPIVTRDLLPLGSPSTMDLLYALDDRFQAGTAELESVAPVARLLGADTIWLTGDAAFDRFRTPRPELTSDRFAAGADDPQLDLGAPVPYGSPAVNAPSVPMVDEQSLSEPSVASPVAPVELVPVEDPVAIVRATDDVVVVSGSGDGLVDAAAAGLIFGDEAILYSASLTGDDLVAAIESSTTLIVTDTNRRRAHHWRSSQDVTGYSETGEDEGVVWNDPGDARLVVFPDAEGRGDLTTNTLSRSEGPVTAVATSYGARFDYQPEARAAMAIDGDPNTAWTVLDHPFQHIEIRTAAPVDHVTLLQPNGLEPVRHLRTVLVSVDDAPPFRVELDDRSLVAGQPVPFAATAGPTRIRIELESVTSPDRAGRPDRTGVGFAEIDTGLGPSPEALVVPTDLTDAMAAAGSDRPVSYVLTRERASATNRWRSDPEWRIVRAIEIPATQDTSVDVDVRLDRRAADAELATLLGIEGPTASARLTGVPSAGGWMAADGDPATAWITPFNNVVGSSLNATLVDPGAPLTIRQRPGNYTRITGITLTSGETTALVALPEPDAAGESTVTVPEGFTAGPLRIEISGVVERVTRDRRFADTVLMPAAISEITNIEPAELPRDFATDCRDDLVSIDGEPVRVRVAGTVTDAFSGEALTATVCDGSRELGAGEHRVTGQANRRSGLHVDRIVLHGGDPGARRGEAAGASGPSAVVVDQSRLGRTVDVTRCEEGCWLIVGEGHHDAWSASVDGAALGAPTLVSGGFNGWWVAPELVDAAGSVTVDVRWTAQRPLSIALIASGLAAIVCVVLAARDRPRHDRTAAREAMLAGDRPRLQLLGPSDGIRRSAAAAAAWVILAGLFVAPGYVWWGLLGGLAVVLTRRIRLAAWFAVFALVRIALGVIRTVWRDHPPADPGFPGLFENLHRLGQFAAVALLVGAMATRRQRSRAHGG